MTALIEPEPFDGSGWPETDAMDIWLDSLTSVLAAIGHRRMSGDQLDRYARLLNVADTDALSRTRRRLLRHAK